MIKKTIIIALFSLPFLVVGQEKKEKQSITKIGVNYSADYTYRHLIMDSYYHTGSIQAKEAAVYGFHTGLNFQHQFRFGLILESGLQYSRFGGKIKNLASIDSNGEVSEQQILPVIMITWVFRLRWDTVSALENE